MGAKLDGGENETRVNRLGGGASGAGVSVGAGTGVSVGLGLGVLVGDGRGVLVAVAATVGVAVGLGGAAVGVAVGSAATWPAAAGAGAGVGAAPPPWPPPPIVHHEPALDAYLETNNTRRRSDSPVSVVSRSFVSPGRSDGTELVVALFAKRLFFCVQ